MKIIPIAFLLLLSSVAFTQNHPSIEKIDAMVESIDTATASPIQFSKVGYEIINKKRTKITKHYVYNVKGNNISKIIYSFANDDESIEQGFYINNNALIFAYESTVSYYKTNNRTDSTTWGGRYYFFKHKLIDQRTFGHGKSEEDGWNPKKEMLDNYSKAKKEVVQYMHNRK